MKRFFTTILMLLFVVQGALASDRVNQMIEEDAMESLQRIAVKKKELSEQKQLLKQIESKLKASKKGFSVYVKLTNVEGTLVIAAIVVGTYKAHFPLGMRVLLETYLSKAGTGSGFIKLNSKDIQKMNKELSRMKTQIKISESSLNIQIKYLCEQDSRHQLCY